MEEEWGKSQQRLELNMVDQICIRSMNACTSAWRDLYSCAAISLQKSSTAGRVSIGSSAAELGVNQAVVE